MAIRIVARPIPYFVQYQARGEIGRDRQNIFTPGCKSPMTAPKLYPEHDIFIQLMKLKNTLRHLRGEDLITHLGLEYYD